MDFTRQVFAPEPGAEDDFDGVAIGMGITLLYGAATGTEESDCLWIESPSQIGDGLKRHGAEPLVAELLHVAQSRYVAVVGLCG